jgi:cellulose synthase/poly-beta-1,6-N-acetylglucosamine synthase-like glycosyltransferase
MAGLLALPTAVLLAEILAAAWIGERTPPLPRRAARPKVAVLVPAHNEGARIVPTLQDIKAQLADGDRLIVIADNCDDGTAAVAAEAGAEVVERNDRARIGKGYALDFGVRHLSARPPAIVIVIDADCRLAEGAIEQLAAQCSASGRPAQALYLMQAPERSSLNYQVAAFAWRVKNWVRPLGSSALGLPCQLVGTGMALPWDALRSIDLASGEIVEDLKLGLDLAAAGHAPVFCPSAVVTSEFPSSDAGAQTQRQRWEEGHVGLIMSAVPRMLLLGLRRRDKGLIAMALDLAVPPLALLMLLLLAALAITGLAAAAGLSPLAFQITAAASLAFALSSLVAWWRYGRAVLPVGALLLIGPYVVAKLWLYARLIAGRRAARWIRTDRT